MGNKIVYLKEFKRKKEEQTRVLKDIFKIPMCKELTPEEYKEFSLYAMLKLGELKWQR